MKYKYEIKTYFLILILFFPYKTIYTQSKEDVDTIAKSKIQSLNFIGKKDVSETLPDLSSYPNLISLDLSGSFAKAQRC